MNVDVDIGHLDFPVEVPEEKPKERHWAHPINPSMTWCEKASGTAKNFQGRGALAIKEVTCVRCLQLGLDPGMDWWWNVHNVYYRSSCVSGIHNCKQ